MVIDRRLEANEKQTEYSHQHRHVFAWGTDTQPHLKPTPVRAVPTLCRITDTIVGTAAFRP